MRCKSAMTHPRVYSAKKECECKVAATERSERKKIIKSSLYRPPCIRLATWLLNALCPTLRACTFEPALRLARALAFQHFAYNPLPYFQGRFLEAQSLKQSPHGYFPSSNGKDRYKTTVYRRIENREANHGEKEFISRTIVPAGEG